MRSNNLLSMLTISQNNRGRSMSRQGGSPTFSFMPRSSSSSLRKDGCGNQQKSQLVKLVHLLNVKVKQNYFFSFCRLEQASKATKIDESIKVPYEDIQEEEDEKQNSINEVKDQKTNLHLGIGKMMEFQDTVSDKIRRRNESHFLRSGLASLLRVTSRSKSAEKMGNIFNDKLKSHERILMKGLKGIQSDFVKGQIVLQNIKNIIQRQMTTSLRLIKNTFRVEHKIEKKLEHLDQCQQKISPIIVIQQKQKQEKLIEKKQEIKEQHQKIKVRLKQKKVAIVNSISLTINKICKSAAIPKIDSPLNNSVDFQEQLQQPMKRFLNQKPQQFTSCLPDLPDNCNLFRQSLTKTVPKANNLHKVSELSPINQKDEPKTFESRLEQEELNDRIISEEVCEQPEKKERINFYQKHKSVGNIWNKVTSKQQSPLMRVEQLLRNMKNIQSNKQSQKNKKQVFVTISRDIYQDTPTKYSSSRRNSCSKCLGDLLSSDKENICERIVTQISKNQNSKGGLQIQKAKGTQTIKDRKKGEKSQIFTARKMKIQIENIINRRNRQLRSQLRLVK